MPSCTIHLIGQVDSRLQLRNIDADLDPEEGLDDGPSSFAPIAAYV
jgi:hypothetical protein